MDHFEMLKQDQTHSEPSISDIDKQIATSQIDLVVFCCSEIITGLWLCNLQHPNQVIYATNVAILQGNAEKVVEIKVDHF